MKTLIRYVHVGAVAFCLSTFIAAMVLAPLAITAGCSTAPSSRVSQVMTLKAVGHSAEAAVQSTARLFQAGTITAAQAKQVMDVYDLRFQPAFRLAVTAVNSNLDSVSSPDLIILAAELSALILQFTTPAVTPVSP